MTQVHFGALQEAVPELQHSMKPDMDTHQQHWEQDGEDRLGVHGDESSWDWLGSCGFPACGKHGKQPQSYTMLGLLAAHKAGCLARAEMGADRQMGGVGNSPLSY